MSLYHFPLSSTATPLLARRDLLLMTVQVLMWATLTLSTLSSQLSYASMVGGIPAGHHLPTILNLISLLQRTLASAVLWHENGGKNEGDHNHLRCLLGAAIGFLRKANCKS